MKVTLDTGTTYDLSKEDRHKNLKININKLKGTANKNQQHRSRLISICNQVRAYKDYQGDDTAQKNAREIYNLVAKFDEGDKLQAEKKEAKPIPAPPKSVGKTPIIKKAGTKVLAPEANEISDKKENVDAALLPDQPKPADTKMPLIALSFFGSTYKKHLSQRTYNKHKFDIATKNEKLKTYLDKPVTEKKKIGEDNFSESAAWLLFDLENYKSPADLLPQYVALTCGLFMHNSSHYPMQGFGKAQALEIDYKLQYFRSEANHPRRIFFDDLMDDTYKGKKSYLPRNTPFTKMLAKASLDRSFENKFKKLDEAGFAMGNDDVPNFGPIIGYTGARANNLWAYIYAIDRKCKSTDNESYINNIKDLIKNLFDRSLPNKLKKIAPNDTTNRINYLINYYQKKNQTSLKHLR